MSRVAGSPFRIRPLHLGSLVEVERCIFLPGHPAGDLYDAPCIAWLVENGSKAVLVDSGPGSPSRAQGHHPALVQEKVQVLTEALRISGYGVADIDGIVLTHLHWDHVGGLHEIPGVPIYVQKEELRYAVWPDAAQRGPYEIGISGLRPAWFDHVDRFVAVDGCMALFPGLDLVPMPGHTPGSQGLLVETAGLRHVITGDTIPLFLNWSANPSQRRPNGVHTDLDAYESTFAHLAMLRAVVLPGHDPLVFEHREYPVDASAS